MSDVQVSVVLAVKNEQVHIQEAVLSVLGQAGIDFEVIVVDDNSNDDTFAIVSKIAEKDSRLRLFRNPKAGKCSAFNLGVANATGHFVCLFAGDDVMPRESLVARWRMVKDQPQDSPVVGLCKLVTMSTDKRFDGHLVPRKPGKGGYTGVSYLMNRAVVRKIFPVPESLPNEDTWMELAVIHFPGWIVVHSDVIGCAWRVHSGNSINMMVGFDEYNAKYKPRMRAISLFHERHAHELLPDSELWLRGKVDCEKCRAAGNIAGIFSSKVGFVDKLRALSTANSFFYELRKRLFGLLSGW